MVSQKHVGIVIFNNVEVLDFCGPFEVFSITRLDERIRRDTTSPFQVSLIAENEGVVTATGGLRVLPDYTLDNCPRLDLLLVAGGWGTRAEVNNETLLKWLREKSTEVELLCSVCTGAVLLGKAGLLDGKNATTHFRALDWFRDTCPKVKIERDLHVVQDGTCFTSAGISAGIDMTLAIVAHYFGKEIATNTALHMEYAYDESNQRRAVIT